MQQKVYEKRTLKELRKGDIIHMGIPFEENTTDYYNGFSPKEIRGALYTDKDGKSSKRRYVVVIGRDENSVQYLPLTSRSSGFDKSHQYELEDNSMTYRKDENMKSYVEIDSLRSVYVNPKWDINYQGRIAENDMVNIMVKLSKRTIDFESDHDQRAYVSQSHDAAFIRTLDEQGYELVDSQFDQKTYIKEDGRSVTKTKWGLVQYHVPLSREEVTRLVAEHEGRPFESYKGSQSQLDDFSRAVADLSKIESEVTR